MDDEVITMKNGLLVGRDAIEVYVGRSWKTIIKWIKEESFPAKKMNGVWGSDRELIAEWHRRQIGSEGKR